MALGELPAGAEGIEPCLWLYFIRISHGAFLPRKNDLVQLIRIILTCENFYKFNKI